MYRVQNIPSGKKLWKLIFLTVKKSIFRR